MAQSTIHRYIMPTVHSIATVNSIATVTSTTKKAASILINKLLEPSNSQIPETSNIKIIILIVSGISVLLGLFLSICCCLWWHYYRGFVPKNYGNV